MQTAGAGGQSLLPISAVTEQYGIAKTAIEDAIREKELPVITKGRARLVERVDLERWIRGGGGNAKPSN